MPTFVTPTTYTPVTNSAWNTVDASALVPAGASGVICYLRSDASGVETGIRKNGSTDNVLGFLPASGYTTVCIGVDGSRHFQVYKSGSEAPTVVVYGYFTSSEATFFTNYTSFTIATAYAWQDVDISGISTGALAAVGFTRGSPNSGFAVRKNGSTDNRINDSGNFDFGGFVVGVDGSSIFEASAAETSTVGYICGYISANITTHTNGTDKTPGTTGSYQTLAALPAGAIAGLYEVKHDTSTSGSSALRKNGDSLDIYGPNGKAQRTHIAECDASRICEAKISASTVKIFEQGYFTAAGGGAAAGPNLLLMGCG